MKFFVTGATGFIGVPLVKRLIERGDETVLLVRNVERAREIFERFPDLKYGIEFIRGDLDDVAGLKRALRGCEGVFHLAGMISYRSQDRREILRVNRDGTRNVARAALETGAKRLVHTSSIVAIGISWDPHDLLDEATPYNAEGLGLAYFDAKHAAEIEISRAAKLGLDAVIVNPGTVAGRASDAGPPGNINRALRTLARLPFALPGGNAWVDVLDVVQGHLLAFEKGRASERYILATENLSNAEIAARLASRAGRRTSKMTIPRRGLKALARVARLGERVAPTLQSQSATRASGFYLYMDSGKARRELGWDPRSPWEAIEEMGSLRTR